MCGSRCYILRAARVICALSENASTSGRGMRTGQLGHVLASGSMKCSKPAAINSIVRHSQAQATRVALFDASIHSFYEPLDAENVAFKLRLNKRIVAFMQPSWKCTWYVKQQGSQSVKNYATCCCGGIEFHVSCGFHGQTWTHVIHSCDDMWSAGFMNVAAFHWIKWAGNF